MKPSFSNKRKCISHFIMSSVLLPARLLEVGHYVAPLSIMSSKVTAIDRVRSTSWRIWTPVPLSFPDLLMSATPTFCLLKPTWPR